MAHSWILVAMATDKHTPLQETATGSVSFPAQPNVILSHLSKVLGSQKKGSADKSQLGGFYFWLVCVQDDFDRRKYSMHLEIQGYISKHTQGKMNPNLCAVTICTILLVEK